MAGLKRFVTYIYSYEENYKRNNVGFAKIEIRGAECRLEIHLRGMYISQTRCRIGLFLADGGDILGFPIGELTIANGMGDWRSVFPAEKIGGLDYGIEDMEGLVLVSQEEHFLLSRWKEGEPLRVGTEHFRLWEPETSGEKTLPEKESLPEEAGQEILSEEESATEQPDRKMIAAEGSAPEQDILTEEKFVPEQGTLAEEKRVPERDISATEVPMRNFFPRYSWEEVWELLRREHPVFAPFEDENILCARIELKDLRELPKRYWYLGNNSFLLHGFFNYRYLVIGKLEEDRWFLGVPGVYQNQERVMAAIFGFPEFLPEAFHMEGTPEQGEPLNRFGYWYRLMEE
ncbi:MAG: DUF6128 domain-containing protein [Roseburia sp.]